MSAHTFFQSIAHRLRRADLFRIEEVPLHTESAAWAALAPSQVTAALKRGAHVIGFTEVHTHLSERLSLIAEQYGYTWVFDGFDVALAVKSNLPILSHTTGVVRGRPRTQVALKFHGSTVSVFALHWTTNTPAHFNDRAVYTASVIEAVHIAAEAQHLAFFMGDCNPAGAQRQTNSLPRATLDKAGLISAYEEVGNYPQGIGATLIGRYQGDTRVKALKVETYPRLGSDHLPASATYAIRRLRSPKRR